MKDYFFQRGYENRVLDRVVLDLIGLQKIACNSRLSVMALVLP